MPISAAVPIGTVTVGTPMCRIARLPLATQTAVAPCQIRRGRGHVGIRRADVGDRRKDHGIQLQPVHPILEIGAARRLEPAQPIRAFRECRGNPRRGPRGQAPDTRRWRRRTRYIGLAARPRGAERSARHRHRPASRQRGVGVAAQEISHDQTDRSRISSFEVARRRHKPAGADRRCARAVAFVVGNERKIGDDHLCPRRPRAPRGPLHNAMNDARVTMRWPVGPPMPASGLGPA